MGPRSRGEPVHRGPPRHPAPEAKRYWRSHVGELWAAGALSPLRRDLLARYCEMAAIADRARDRLIQSDVLIRGRRDHVVANPAWRVFRDAVKEQLDLGRALGLLTHP